MDIFSVGEETALLYMAGGEAGGWEKGVACSNLRKMSEELLSLPFPNLPLLQGPSLKMTLL